MKKISFISFHDVQEKLEHYCHDNMSNLGKAYMLIATVFSTLGFAFAKSSQSHNLNTVVFLRSLVNSQISYQIVHRTGLKTIGDIDFIKKIMVRAVIGTCITYLFQKGLMHVPLQECLTLVNTQPVFTFWLSLYFLGEKFRSDKLMCTIVTIIGVALIVNPNYLFLDFSNHAVKNEMFYLAVFLLLLSALLRAFVIIIVKTINKTSPFLNLLYLETSRLMIAGVGFVVVGDTFKLESLRQFMFLILYGISEYLYHVFTIMALRYTTASAAAILETMTVLLGFLLDIFIYKEPIYFGSVVGAALVVASSIYLTQIKDC
jgi:drug/metabolite transporter (DMT)-like permease